MEGLVPHTHWLETKVSRMALPKAPPKTDGHPPADFAEPPLLTFVVDDDQNT